MTRHLRSLVVLFPALLAAIVIAVALVTARMVERQMTGVLLTARGAELAVGAQRIARLLGAGFATSAPLYAAATQLTARTQRAFSIADSASAMRTLRAMAPVSSADARFAMQLIDTDGRVRADLRTDSSGTPVEWPRDAITEGTVGTSGLTVSPLLASSDTTLYFALTHPVRNVAGDVVAWYAEAHHARASGLEDIRALIGVPTLLVGQDGGGVWTDLTRAVAEGPPSATLDSAVQATSTERGDVVGYGTRVPGTSWVLWVEQPSSEVFEPVRTLFKRLWPIIAIIALVGAFFAWLIGRVASNRIRLVADELDRTLARTDIAPQSEAVDEIAALENAYQRLESRIAQQQRLDAQVLQSQKLEAVGRLAGGIAHDFNNLLTVVMNYGQLVRDALPPNSAEAEDMGEVLNATERAAGLTRQLLAFSRQHLVDPQPMDIVQSIIAEDRMLTRLIRSDIVRRLDLPREPLVVTIDAVQFQQLLMNLVLNSVDAMPEGGQLTIRAAREELAGSELDTLGLPGGAYACVTVTDTGTGMSAETLARVFDPFFTTKSIGKGTGLGLATVHGVVTQAHGRVWAYSEVGVGTSMKVYLPLTDAPATVDSRAVRRGRPTTPATGLVVLVEDDTGTRAVTARILGNAGYTVKQFETANDAFAWLEAVDAESLPRAVLSDVMMPGMSGIELARRTALRWPRLSFVLMSGYSDVAARLGDLTGPRPIILEKPFTASALLDAMHLATTF